MTENERMSISGLLDVLNTGISLSTCHMEYTIQSNVLEDLILYLEEIQQYRAIGTVEECRTAYSRGYNQGTIDRAEELQQCREYGYNKAIDDMQGNLIRNSRTEVIDGEICLIVTDKRIKQIAEEMRGAE